MVLMMNIMDHLWTWRYRSSGEVDVVSSGVHGASLLLD